MEARISARNLSYIAQRIFSSICLIFVLFLQCVLFTYAGTPTAQAAPAACGKWRKRFAFESIHGHAMVYDSQRGVTVLFGGHDGTYLNETWEWDGDIWELKANTGPAGRRYHAMAYDSDRGITVLFGGEGETTNFKDTWEWDGSKWTEKSGTGPAHPLLSQGMAYDAKNKQVVMYGGFDGSDHKHDTWVWDGTQWKFVTSGVPYAPGDPAMAYDAKREEVVLYGGFQNGNAQDNTWVWKGTYWHEQSVTAPMPLTDAAMAYDSERQVVVLFGGYHITPSLSLGAQDVVWEWNGSNWLTRSLTTVPEARYIHQLVYDSKRKRLVMVGGTTSPSAYYSDTWEWDGGANWERILKGGAPERRLSSAMVYDSNREVTVLVGGAANLPPNPGPYRDTWEWDGREWSLQSTTGPSAIFGHAMAYDSDRGVAVLFGGADDLLIPNADTWEWDGTWSPQGTSTTLLPTYSHTMTYDSARKKVVLFGGADVFTIPQGTTAEYDGVKWELITPSGSVPSPRIYPAMAYDSSRGVSVMHGGSPTWPNTNGETWEWNGSS